ncbi:MAG: hypothetical protein H0X33_00460 [Taibaiella sp.]|nr:hypothetical protein [Taibaiella sp.]
MNQKNNHLENARRLYYETSLNQKEIAGHVGVSDKTISTWIRTHAWDKLKQAAQQAPVVIVENLHSQIVSLQNHIQQREGGFPTIHEAEIQRKLILSIERLKSNIGPAQNIQMMENFIRYLMPINKDLAKELTSYAHQYLTTKTKPTY